MADPVCNVREVPLLQVHDRFSFALAFICASLPGSSPAKLRRRTCWPSAFRCTNDAPLHLSSFAPPCLPCPVRTQFTSQAEAAILLAKRRAQVHDRYLKFWAKKVLVAPEQAVVPLKSVDYQLASKFEVGSRSVEVRESGGRKL